MEFFTLQKLIEASVSSGNKLSWFIPDEWYSPYYSLLYLLALHLDEHGPNKPIAVELGVDKGRGSFALLEGNARVFGVEQNDKECFAMSNPHLTLLKCSSTPVPLEIAALGKSIDILHVDTEHSFAQAREEFNAYKPYLKDGAVVLFDDTNAMEGEVRRFVESLPYEKFFDDRLHEHCGYGGLIYRD